MHLLARQSRWIRNSLIVLPIILAACARLRFSGKLPEAARRTKKSQLITKGNRRKRGRTNTPSYTPCTGVRHMKSQLAS